MASSSSSSLSEVVETMESHDTSNESIDEEEANETDESPRKPVQWLDYNGEPIYLNSGDDNNSRAASDDFSFDNATMFLPANLQSNSYEPSEIDSEECASQFSDHNSEAASVKPFGLALSLHRIYGSQPFDYVTHSNQPPITTLGSTNDAIFHNLMAMSPWQPEHYQVLHHQQQKQQHDSPTITCKAAQAESDEKEDSSSSLRMVSCESDGDVDAAACCPEQDLSKEAICSDGSTHETFPSHKDQEIPREQYCPQEESDNANLNMPHPSLEYPPFYFFLKKWGLLDHVHGFYKIRWSLTYPLQKRVYTKGFFHKIGVFWTWGELLLLIPFVVSMAMCVFYAFVDPSVTKTGHAARWPLLFCFPTGIRNSFLTFLLGMPYERAFWYHKMAGRIAFVAAILHAVVSVTNLSVENGSLKTASRIGQEDETVTVAGTMLFVCSCMMVVTSVPSIRKKLYELFFYAHIIFAAGCLVCAFFHTHWLGPAVGLCFWGSDVIVRKVYMAGARHPKKATLRIISKSVVEVSFPKTEWFDYNPGQYIRLCIPDITLFEWHPFYMSSCPQEQIVTIHIRVSGNWTRAVQKLATEQEECSILFDGPYGSVALDVIMNDRYKMVMLLSGGIGVTPMQSLSNQLIFEYATRQRSLKKLSFVWMERDPMAVQHMDVTRKDSSIHMSIRGSDFGSELGLSSDSEDEEDHDDDYQYDCDSVVSPDAAANAAQVPMGIASTLLTFIAPSSTTDSQLNEQFPSEALDGRVSECDDGSLSSLEFDHHEHNESSDTSSSDLDLEDGVDGEECPYNVLDLNVFLTEGYSPSIGNKYPFVYAGIPNVNTLFYRMRQDAIEKGERRVAVCICAADRLVVLCRKACVKFTDKKVRFDIHEEYYE